MTEKVTLQTTIRRITGRNPIDPYTWMPELTNTEGIDLTKGITFPGVTFYKLEKGEYVPKAYRIFLEEDPDGTWMFEWEDEKPMNLATAINDYINVNKGLTHHAFQEPSEYVKAEVDVEDVEKQEKQEKVVKADVAELNVAEVHVNK